jgi:S-DNA-T family DNA segregation ATPase FtsK/SpoIIIE
VSTVIVRRGERREGPELPHGEIILQAPPEIPELAGDALAQMLTYLPMLAMTFGMVAMMSGTGSGALRWVGGGALGLGMGGMALGQLARGRGDRKVKLNGLRRDYLRYLSQVRRKVRRVAAAQREALAWSSPEPGELHGLVTASDLARVWERRPSDDDFGSVRLGTGTQHLAVRLIPPQTKPAEDLDPLCAGALRRFIRAHARQPGLPVGISLRAFSRVTLSGDTDAAAAMVRAMIAQIAVFHSPDDVRICVCASPDRIARWGWVKWLPHNMHPAEYDAAGPVRLMAPSLAQLESMLGPEFSGRPRFTPGKADCTLPYHVLVVDGVAGGYGDQVGVDGATIFDLSGRGPAPDNSVLRLRLAGRQLEMVTRDRTGADVVSRVGVADRLSLPEAEALARQLAPMRPLGGALPGEDALAVNTTLTSLLGIDNPESLAPADLWRARAARNRLRVPIGLDAGGQAVELDIKESAQGGMGPHGLIIGATGSGKSELLRTLVLGLALTHSPEILNFVLVDFKGGATFLGLERLNHVSAVITNLEEELPLVDRMRDALHGEVVRRQELLRAAGNYASLRDYERDRERGAKLAPLPTLFIVLDEFSELLAAKPEFIDLFVMIGRVGRSLGVHLLLASQRLEEGRLRGLDTQLSYRIGLRTYSAAESRIVLGVPDAYELPSRPGSGYLKTEATEMTRFKAGYVSGAAGGEPGPARVTTASPWQIRPMVVPYSPGYVKPKVVPKPAAQAPAPGGEGDGALAARPGQSLFEVVIRQLAGAGPQAHQIWLPPLDLPPALDQLLPPLSITPGYGCTADGWRWRGKLRAVTGIVDRPYEQRRDPLWADLSGAAGNVGVAGGPQSGKSTVLRTLICSLALLHTPQEIQFYCLDFGGGTIGALSGLPHVGGVATRLQAERVRRTVAEVRTVLERREQEFAERGIESIAAYRAMRASGEIAGDGFGDVFLVVDGWLTLRQEYEQLELDITALAARGLGYGIHVVAATNKWSEFRPAIRDLLGTRFELRLGDPYESEMGRTLAANVPERSPGRGLTRDGLHFLTALPRIDGQLDAASLPEAVRKLVETVAAAWQGPPAPAVRLLPGAFSVTELPGPAESGTRLPFAVDEATLSPVFLDFAADPHFLVLGDTETGKSNLLHLISDGITARYSLDQARIIVVDYRRSLLDAADTEHRIGYAPSSAAAVALLNDAREALAKRLPPADLTADQLRNRSWWQGSDLFVIVDDYDLVAGVSNPLLPLVDLLPQAREIGLHLILARSAGGAGRAMFEPVIQRLREMGSTALLMSANKDEGPIFGIKPVTLPAGRGYLATRRADPLLVQTAFATSPDLVAQRR